MSKASKHYLTGAIIFTLLSFLCCVGPALYYIVEGYLIAGGIHRVALCLSVFIALIGSCLCLMTKHISFRSGIWFILLALYFIIENFTPMIILFGATQILDEVLLSPVSRHYRSKFSINREIDKRGGNP